MYSVAFGCAGAGGGGMAGGGFGFALYVCGEDSDAGCESFIKYGSSIVSGCYPSGAAEGEYLGFP